MSYQEMKFALPELQGISAKQLDVHLKLYAGYVKNLNLALSTIAAYEKTDDEGGKYAIAELRRRIPFEFDGMRMHEYYFSQWEKGSQALDASSALGDTLTKQFGDLAAFETKFKGVGMTRGIGWTVLYFDKQAGQFQIIWVGDHELGQLSGVPIIAVMDMWEHAYMVDYAPADKKNYIDAFWKNLNWSVMERRFTDAQ